MAAYSKCAGRLPLLPLAACMLFSYHALASAPHEKGLPADWELTKTVIPGELPEGIHFQYSLEPKDSDKQFPLARLYVFKERTHFTEDIGFNPESLSTAWLELDKLLLVRWSTHPRGQGTNTMQTHLLLMRTNGDWSEVYRHTQPEYARRHKLIRSGFSYDLSNNILTIQDEDGSRVLQAKSARLDSRARPAEGPLDGGEVIHIYRWQFRVDGGNLAFLNGTMLLDLDRRHFNVWQPEKDIRVARDFDVIEIARYLCPDNVEQQLLRLYDLHPELRNAAKWSGVVVADDQVPWRGADERMYYSMTGPDDPDY